MQNHWEEFDKKDTEMAKREALHTAVLLSMRKERDAVNLKRDVQNQALLDSKDKAMKYIIQIEKKESSEFQENFYQKSSLMLDKNR